MFYPIFVNLQHRENMITTTPINVFVKLPSQLIHTIELLMITIAGVDLGPNFEGGGPISCNIDRGRQLG